MVKIRWFCCFAAMVLLMSAGLPAGAADAQDYTIVEGDTLWDISEARLGNPFLWPALWKENPRIADPNRIYPGQTIKIPSAAGPGEEDGAAAAPTAADMKPAAAAADRAAAPQDQEKTKSSTDGCERKTAPALAADPYPGLRGVVLYDGTVVEGRILFLSAEIVTVRLPDGRTVSYSFLKEVSHFVKN